MEDSLKVAVMGFGNPVRSDDAVGVHIVQELKKDQHLLPHVTLLDMGTGAFEVLFNLKGHKKIIIIDAVINSGEPDGTLFKLPASEINTAIQDDPLVFLHSMKWDQGLSYAKKILGDDFPENIEVYLVAISKTKLEIEMSEDVLKAANKLVDRLSSELKSVSC